MKSDEKIKKLALALAEKKTTEEAAKTAIRTKYEGMEKIKKLTTDERLTRIEKYLGIS
jgi:DNA-binding protein YbaB